MKIKNRRLFIDDHSPVDFRLSPETKRGAQKLDHKFLVVHYRAGASKESGINWFL